MHRVAFSTIEEVINASTVVFCRTHQVSEREMVVYNEENDLMVEITTISAKTTEGYLAFFYKIRAMAKRNQTFRIDLIQSPAELISTALDYMNESATTDKQLGTYTKAKVAAH